MKVGVTKIDIWTARIEDRPGALGDKLAPLAGAKVNLEFLVARRTPEEPGSGIVFAAPIKGAGQMRAARNSGFEKSSTLGGLRLEAGNAAGLAAKVAKAVGEAGINLRGIAGSAIGNKAVLYLAFDSADDAANAQRALKKLT